jgi:hypothetical protein
MHGVFLLPGRSLHLLEAGTHDHLDVLAAEPARGAAAIHRGVAAAEHDHALADLVDVAERDAGEPVDADMDVACGLLAAGDIEFAAARRARADEDRIVIVCEKLLQALDAVTALELDAETQDVIGLFVDHGVGQAEFRNLAPHHAAGLRIGIEHRAVIAERREIARHRQRGGPAADQRDALAVLRSALRQAMPDVVLEVGGDALQAADRDRSLFDAAAAARRFAWTVACASENSRKYVRLPIDHVGVAIAAFGDQADVFGNRGVCGTGPLAIDHFVKVVRGRNVSRFHSYLVRADALLSRGLFCCRTLIERPCGF